ncbi:unnamed protein product [Hermetia illucens]|uniref:Ornithine decarboxylase antizyme n=1 Tax=Hermetia illucens TaxID=343691 RepID=A0A7R8U9Z5_HERIL|nr:unnamed protein product [Hermetia illucens]
MPSIMNSNREPMFSSSSSSRSSSSVNKRTMSTSSNATTITDHDRASLLNDYNRKTSVASASGSSSNSDDYSDTEFSESAFDDVLSTRSDDDCHEVVNKIVQQKTPTRVLINLHVTENAKTTWDTVLNPINNILYVDLPEVLPQEGSRQSFISLLEFAEEKLEVDAVVLCMAKDRQDRSKLVKTFLFLGFQPLSSKSPLAPPRDEHHDEKNLFLIYNIED